MYRRSFDLFRCVFFLVCLTFPLTLILEKNGDMRRKQLKDELSISELWYTAVNSSKPDDITCYDETGKHEVFEDILKKVVFPNTIFFHETSCSRNLPMRQACAIESAARSFPERQVAVLFAKPLTGKECSRGPLEEVLKLGNVDFARVNLSNYSSGTPLETIFEKNFISKGMPYHKRVAYYLKFLTLYRYGGTVIDLDMMVTPEMDYLIPNWLVKDDNKKLTTAIISIAKDNMGEKLARDFLSALADQAKLDDLDEGRAMYEVLSRHCNTSDVNQITYSKCKVHVQGSDILYPANQSTWLDYLKPMENSQATYAGYYIRDGENNNKMIPLDSLYAKITREYCPNMFNRFISEYIDLGIGGKMFMGIV